MKYFHASLGKYEIYLFDARQFMNHNRICSET